MLRNIDFVAWDVGTVVTLKFENWLDKHWQYAQHKHGDCVFVHSRAGALLRSVLDEYCLQRSISPIRWRMTELDIHEPYSPLMPILKALLQRHGMTLLEDALDEMELHGVERSLIQDYLSGRDTYRLEFPLPDDLAFQSIRIRQILIRLLSLLATGEPQLLLVTGIQFAGSAGLKLIEELLQYNHAGNFLMVIGIDPAFQHIDENRQQHWEQWLSVIDSRGIIYPHEFDTSSAPFMNWPGLTHAGVSHDYEALKRCEQLIDLLCFQEAVDATTIQVQRLESNIANQDGTFVWQLLLCHGRAQLYCGNYEDAIVTFDRLLEIAQQNSNSANLCCAYRELATTHIFRSDLTSAMRYSQLAIKLASAIDDDLLQTKALFCHFVASDKANVPFGVERLRQLLIQLEIHQMISGRIYVLRNLYAQVPFEVKLDLHTALDCSVEAIQLARHYRYETDLAAAFHSRGIIYNKMGRHHSALRCFRISEYLREKLNVPGELARIRNGIGYILCQREKYTEAHRYYLLALNTVLRLNDFSEITISLYNLAWLYAEVRENDSALMVVNTLREMLRIRGTNYFPFRNSHDVLLLQCMIHINQGEWSRAEQDLERSYNLDISISSEGKYIRPILKARIEAHHQNYSAALLEMEKAKQAETQLAELNIHHQLLWHEVAIRLHRQLNETALAYSHLHSASRLCSQAQFALHLKRLVHFWHQDELPAAFAGLQPPKLELDQLLHLVRQEQRMNQLWQRVHEMRLLATLQQLAVDLDSEQQIAAETLRLICTHFNAQAGFLLVNEDKQVVELAQFSQVPDSTLDGQRLSDWLGHHQTTRLLFNGEVPAHDDPDSPKAVRFSSVLGHPLLEGQRQIGEMLLLTFADSAPLNKSDRDILQFIGNQLAGQLVNLRQRRQLIELSSTDTLTGLRNRQSFQAILRNELKRIGRYGSEHPYLALAFVDLDNFKYYNDSFGHEAGDRLLCWFADLLVEALRDFDICCRWGGDEFLILFPHTRADEAMIPLRRIIELLALQQGYTDALANHLGREVILPQDRWLNCSIGVSDTLDEQNGTLDEVGLLQRADRALYEVKRHGKGQVFLASHQLDHQIA